MLEEKFVWKSPKEVEIIEESKLSEEEQKEFEEILKEEEGNA